MTSQIKERAMHSAIIAIAVCFWEVFSRYGKAALFVSSPIRVLKYLSTNSSAFWTSLTTTAVESIGGLTIAALGSIALATLFYISPRTHRFTYPWISATQVIPFVAIAPAVVLAFGPTSIWGKIFLSALVAFFPILSNVLSGLRTIRRESLELMEVLAIGKLHTFRIIVIPHVTHYFLTGLFIASPLCVIGSIIAEFNGARYGLGKDIFIAAKRLEPELMMSGILGSAILSTSIAGTVRLLESFLGSWYSKGN
ncbi:MAG: ABC transporter permease subunit [Pirellulaceae bacterium]|nr:ABC transporter permease subunit [Pirellulaceae bacterium]